MKAEATLEDFSLAPLSHTGLFGVFLGACAVEDALCVLHTGVGCKAKTQARLVHHDLGRESHTRVGWTELSEEELIQDPGRRLAKTVSELHGRRNPKIILLTASSAVEYTGIDLAKVAARSREELGCPVIAVPGVTRRPDLHHGYAAVIRALLSEVPWERRPTGRVSLTGYLFHRHELEQAANLAELKRLVGALGAKLGPTFLGGESYSSLMRAHQSSLLACLPCGDLEASEIAKLSGRKTVSSGLPLSVKATSLWLGKIGSGLGLDKKRIAEIIATEEAKALPRIEQVQRRLPRLLPGNEIAILADTPSAAGWTLLALELGLKPALVVLLDRHKEPEKWYHDLIADLGAEVPTGLKLIARPSLVGLRRLVDSQPVHLAVRPDLDLSGTAWEAIPTVEYGFPANRKHFVYPLPELGYAGAVALAQRVMDAASRVH